MGTTRKILFAAASAFLMFACGNKHENAENEPGSIEISNQQFTINGMQLGKVEKRVFENVVKSNGIIIPLPNGSAKVNAPINGLIIRVNCNNGQFVQKDQILAEIGGADILDLQKEFAIIAANLKRLKSEFERIKFLHGEKVSSEKEYILAEAEYNALLANYNGLRLKIESIGLSSARIELGEFYSSFYLKAPIDGYISNLKANIGVNVGSQNELLEIVNPDLLQIKLSVFPNDISTIKKGQAVRIKTTNSNYEILGEINAVGVTIDEVSKSIYCFASIIDKKFFNRIANMYVESEIITHVDTVYGIPKSALIKSENKYYVLTLSKQDKDKYIFTKNEVSIGRENNEFFEILENQINGLILIKGGYNITLDE
jgi:cobalt-zinc-cadmium efflux system membrane fusion protein